MTEYFPITPPRGFHAQYVGVPYVWAGSDPVRGWDCWGLYTVIVAKDFGCDWLPAFASVRAPSLAGKSARAQRHEAQARAMSVFSSGAECERIDAPVAGACALFNVAGRPLHVGLCLGHGKFLHVDKKLPTCVESLSCPQWAKRIEGYYVPAR